MGCFFLRLKFYKTLSVFSFRAQCIDLRILRNLILFAKEDQIREILDSFEKFHNLNLSRSEKRFILYHVRDPKKFIDLVENYKIIKRFGLTRYLNLQRVLNILRTKPEKINYYIKLAKNFDNFKLDEDENADFYKFMTLVRIDEKHIYEILEVMIQTKLEGYPLKQKEIIKYFDSNRPFTENMHDLKEAWILAKKNNLNEITIEDFIFVAKNKRKLKKFVINYLLIKSNEIPIPYKEFVAFDFDQDMISTMIKKLVFLIKSNIEIDVHSIIKKLYLGIDVAKILDVYVKFIQSKYEITYQQIENYFKISNDKDKDLLDLYKAYSLNFSGEKPILEQPYKYFYDLKLFLKEKFDPVKFLKAIKKAQDFFEKKSKEDIIKIVYNDTLKGFNVFTILNLLLYAKKHNLNIKYANAKLYEKYPGFSLKEVIHKTLNPTLLESEEFRITTKDNIEISVKVQIEVTLNLDNFFNGTDKDVLFERVYSLLVQEIQEHYDHEELMKNIAEISKKVLEKLPEEEIQVKTNGDFKNKKFDEISKWKVHKILIPRIEFIKETFKEIEKLHEEFELHKKLKEKEIELKEADIEVKKAWARGGNVKYLILHDNFEDFIHGSHSSHSSHDSHSSHSSHDTDTSHSADTEHSHHNPDEHKKQDHNEKHH